MIDQALQGNQGGDRSKLDNIQLAEAPTGTSEAATVRRLRKDRPDLHAQVLDGQISDDVTVLVPINRPADPFGEPELIEVPVAHAAHWDTRIWRERP